MSPCSCHLRRKAAISLFGFDPRAPSCLYVGRRKGGSEKGLVTDPAAWKDFAEIRGCCYIVRKTSVTLTRSQLRPPEPNLSPKNL